MNVINYLKKLFKPNHYISEADQLLAHIRQSNLAKTPGRAEKIEYYRLLAVQRDQPKIVKKKNHF